MSGCMYAVGCRQRLHCPCRRNLAAAPCGGEARHLVALRVDVAA
jgi:hypothetical protein